MAKGNNQKLKLLYLAQIFSQETDEEHQLTLKEIADKLANYGVNADRKTLYLDFEELEHFGLDIEKEQRNRNTYYYLGERDFELPELKLLVDAVQSSRFITNKKSNQLIHKLESLVSRHQANQLHRQVVTTGRIKTMNESIYYAVDTLQEAIRLNQKVRFQYFQWNVKKEQSLRRNGAFYLISPWSLMWDNENYYLVGFDAGENLIKHFRVDKMLRVTRVAEPREGKEAFGAFDLPAYAQRHFGMFGGEVVKVTLEAENSMANILIDRFGKDIFIVPQGADHFRVTVSVAVSNQFFGWVMALGRGIRIVGPDAVVARMQAEIDRLRDQYQS